MADSKLPPRPVVHQCPVCHCPQTKIQRKLSDDKRGSTNYVCSRVECSVGINLALVDTWVAV
jgi:hypothetical protein